MPTPPKDPTHLSDLLPGAVLMRTAEALDPEAFAAETAADRRALAPYRNRACSLALRLQHAGLLIELGRRTTALTEQEQQDAVVRVLDPDSRSSLRGLIQQAESLRAAGLLPTSVLVQR